MATSYPLQVTIIWKPTLTELEELKAASKNVEDIVGESVIKKCKSLISLKKHLFRILGDICVVFTHITVKKGFYYNSIDRSEGKACITKKKFTSISYSEILYSIQCEFHSERLSKECFKKITNLFCTLRKGSNCNPEMWMVFDMTPLVEDHHIKSANENITFSGFSLGNIVGLNTFVSHFISNSSLITYKYKITQIEGKFLHDLQKFDLYFVVGKGNIHPNKRNCETHKLFRLTLQYTSIHKILISSDEKFSLYIHYLQFPILFSVLCDENDSENTDYVSFMNTSPDTQWVRTIDLFKNSPHELRKEFSMNTVLKLDFESSNYDLLIQLKEHCKHFEIYFSPVKVITAVKTIQITSLNSDTFDCFYALKCLLTRSFEVIDQITAQNNVKEVNDLLKKKYEENPTLLVDVLFHIYSSINQGNVVLFHNAIKILFENLDNSSHSFRSNSAENSNKGNSKATENFQLNEILYIRKAFVTPTHVRFLPLHPVLKSRLLRQCDPNFTLRTSVRDVNLKNLNMTVKTGRGKIQLTAQKMFFEHVMNQLLKGIKIGNRHYQYLGGSTSQLRSHGLWYYAKDKENRTSEMIRRKVGFLDEIYLVPKFMARMGQSFSQAMGYIRVPQSNTNVDCPECDISGTEKAYASDTDDENDDEKEKYKRMFLSDVSTDEATKVVSDSDPYIFSDGIGRISQKIAMQIYKKLELEEKEPSAFQIRYAGCKGMLVVDPRILEEKIYFRESMKKFDSSDDSLEILKTSEPRLLYLNRPFITILEQMGIHKDVFLCLQKQTVKRLIGSIFYDIDACQLLKRNKQLRINYDGIFFSHISLTEDPFFRSMVLALFKSELQLLKTKARILIPEDKGRSMFGVLDETSSLQYGEVFVQYTSCNGSEKEGIIVEGTVVVTKNPCMHPGDVRKFKAVNKEHLRHIRDCIVFPAKGPRPHPDEMAGSDLDGDEYAVVWYPDLIFERENHVAMSYSFKPKEKIQELKDRPVTVDDEMRFFCNYILNESVGLLASAHLAYADYNRNGIFDQKCLSIAKQYSKALDFVKTGRPAQMNRKYHAFKYPDFMQKLNEKNSYLSHKALGHLYRNCKQFEMGLEATTHDNEFSIDNDLIYEHWKSYEESAVKILGHYSNQVKSSCRTYGIDNEGEYISGAISKVSESYENRHDYDDLTNILEYEVRKLFQNLEKEFFKEFGGKPLNSKFTENMYRKASAWYVVTYRQINSEQNYYGLPWAVADVLIEIKKMKTNTLSVQGIMNGSILTKKIGFVETVIDKHLRKIYFEKVEKFPIKKLAILETAYEVLYGWLKLQVKNLLFMTIKELEACLDDVFREVSCQLSACEDRFIDNLLKSGDNLKFVSPGHYILESLMKIAELGAYTKQEESYQCVYQEFGLFAWITLTKLGCSRNTEVLGILNSTHSVEGGLYVVDEDKIETIKLPLSKFSSKSPENSKEFQTFSEKIIHSQESVSSFLKRLTNVKYIDMRIHEDKSQSYSLRITVKGSNLSVLRFKDFILYPNFYQSVILEKHPSALKIEMKNKNFVKNGFESKRKLTKARKK